MTSSVAPVVCTATLAVSMLACSPPPPDEQGPTPIPWGTLQNPVLGREEAAIKDAYAVRAENEWLFGYSHLTDTPFRVRVGFSSTSDWETFEHAETMDNPAVGGLASPDVQRMPDGRWVLTYNSHTHDVDGTANKLYYRTSDDLRTWSEPKRIHIEGADGPNDRCIDVSVAFAEAGAFLFFKLEQTAQVAYAASGSIDGPWILLGALDPPALENKQPLIIDGKWHLLGTTIPLVHRPRLYSLEGDPNDPQSWLKWKLERELQVPEEAWNTGTNPAEYERSNAAYLIDERAIDGYFYLLYAGSIEVETHAGRGYSRLGLARSKNLASWEVP